jgi:hypothetical protein
MMEGDQPPPAACLDARRDRRPSSSTTVRTSRSQSRRFSLRLAASAAVAGLVALGAGACSSPGRSQTSTSEAALTADPGVIHVHGIGVDPGDGSLYVATHTGLFRVNDGQARRVGDRYHDLMGFTVAGPGDFIASGHPDLNDESLQKPGAAPLLGLVSSMNGEDWKSVALLGEVDFHSLEAAHGAVYGFDSTSGGFMVSHDRRSWETRSQTPLLDFVVSPDNPDLVLAAAENGVMRSTDGGRSWQLVSPQPFVVLAWNADGPMGAAPDGSVLQGRANGVQWEQVGTLDGSPEALQAHANELYAWVTERGLLRSADGGATWEVILAVRSPGRSHP